MANGKPGAPFGNKNNNKGKRWALAIERAIEAWPDLPDTKNKAKFVIGLERAAHIFVSEMVEQKNIAFFKEFGDRLDGKAVQTIAGDEENPIAFSKIERVIVGPKN